jgi:hypothetical protein
MFLRASGKETVLRPLLLRASASPAGYFRSALRNARTLSVVRTAVTLACSHGGFRSALVWTAWTRNVRSR